MGEELVGKRADRSIGPRRLMAVGTAVASAITGSFTLLDLDTPLGVIAGMSLARGLSLGPVFVSIQTAVYATTTLPDAGRATSLFDAQRRISRAMGTALAATTLPDAGRATSLFDTQRRISRAMGTALATTVLAASVGVLGDEAPALERLPAHQHAFSAVGLVMVPGILVSWWVRADDVAETRGLEQTGSLAHS